MIQKQYVPILKLKDGELTAITKSNSKTLDALDPIFEIPDPDRTANYFTKTDTPVADYINRIIFKLGDFMQGRTAFIDGDQFFDNTYSENGEHAYYSLFNKVKAIGVKAIPVIGLDRWSLPDYRKSMMDIDSDGNYLLRMDFDFMEDSYDIDYFYEQIDEVLGDLKALPTNCAVLLDFGSLCNKSIQDVIDLANNVLDLLKKYKFKFHIFSGCSLPNSISDVVKRQDSTNLVTRKEIIVWYSLESSGFGNIVFSDYGVRGPNSATGGVFPDINGKIRYTVDKAYLISRGHSQRAVGGWSQMKDVSKKVVESGYFMGESYSWGDSYISGCSFGSEKTGNASVWIGIDTNHHLQYVVDEIRELKKSTKVTSEKVT